MEGKIYDAAVIGAGYAGMGAALELAAAGTDVVLLEALAYPGGCASTYVRGGRRYEAGATLFSGFGEGQLFDSWIRRHGICVEFEELDPVLEFRDAYQTIPVRRDREAVVEHFQAFPDVPAEAVSRFFSLQKKISDILWPLFDEPGRLPPLSQDGWRFHLGRIGRYPSIAALAGRTLESVLAREGLAGFVPLASYCDAICQITVQTGIREAEALFALCALDYPYRGTGHVRGGIGRFGEGVLEAIQRAGGDIRLASRAKAIRRLDSCWELDLRGGPVRARQIVSTLLPQDLSALLPEGSSLGQDAVVDALEDGWGAVMLYLVVADHPGLPRSAFHYQAAAEPGQPMQEGNHVFCSLGGCGEQQGLDGERTATVSTHVPARKLREMDPAAQAAYIAEVQERMRRTLGLRVPEVSENVLSSFTASPRTFERFTRRSGGLVGGIPRRSGYHNYMAPLAQQPLPGLWTAGDSHFPGQSILAAAVGGVRAARAATRSRWA